MNFPVLSPPTLYTPSDLRADAALVDKIISVVNEAFDRSKLADPLKWRQPPERRFSTNELYFDMLGQEGIAVVIFDKDAPEKRVAAVAAAVPWGGGWKKEGAGVEHGWEIKAVAVDGSSKYLRRGLAVQMCTCLEHYLASHTRASPNLTSGKRLMETDHLTLWILAAECINGSYWRKRGYRVIRRHNEGPPSWGCQTAFEMVVLRKDIPLLAKAS